MTILLSVHDVREHIRRAADTGGPSDIMASSPLLGRIFHEVAADLVSPDASRNAFSFLENLDFDRQLWSSQLVQHAYERLFGPRLARDQARLQNASSGVLHLWEAVQSLCDWLVDLSWSARNPQSRKKPLSWDDLRESLQPEVPLEAEFQEEGWSEPVRLTGIADSLLKLPIKGHWCVQEFKLGRTSPEADLTQACLYHLILIQNTQERSSRKALRRMVALISFQPAVNEKLFSEEEVASVQEKLLALIGRMAGVTGQLPGKAKRSEVEPAETMMMVGQNLIRVFDEYGCAVELEGSPVSGPAFFRYPVRMGRGVKLQQIQRLAREVQVRLALEKQPLIGVDCGRVVVDIERPDRQIIRFEDVEAKLPSPDPLIGSALAPIGMDLYANLRTADLNDPVNAHLLVAGTTGSGKTEWLRVAIHGLIIRNTPDTLRLILIDPKRTSFSGLRDSPFLLTPGSLVFPDTQPASNVLNDLVEEMERRYLLFHKAGADCLSEYIRATGQVLPRVVCVCDEYYSLIAGDPKRRKEIEVQISLLGAKARAAGIHLILATQQPSREVIRGALDCNIPGRVGLMMVKREESKMLLGQGGAENLLGKGDLLFKDVGEPVRLQAPLL